MNIFRFIADFLHLVSFLILILKIKNTKNCLGLSYKTQEIYLVVFLFRYIDLFLYWVSLYNFLMKIFFIGSTIYIIYLMRFKKPYCLSYDPVGDDFQHLKFLYPAAAILTVFIHTEFTKFEMVWSYSIWLESMAIIPQLYMIAKIKDIENLTGNYVAALGFYRIFYIINWIYRYINEDFLCWTSTLGGIVQTILYADFLYYYILTVKSGKSTISLPV